MTDPELGTTYRLSRSARVSRWWRENSETVSFILLGALVAGSLAAFLLGNGGLGIALATLGLLYLGVTYVRWFWLP